MATWCHATRSGGGLGITIHARGGAYTSCIERGPGEEWRGSGGCSEWCGEA